MYGVSELIVELIVDYYLYWSMVWYIVVVFASSRLPSHTEVLEVDLMIYFI